MPRRYTNPYPPEFRAEAVRLVRDGSRSLNAAAKDLGVSTESLRNWVKQDDLDSGRRKDGLTSEERQELVRLRRENRNLREDKEILKNASFERCCDDRLICPIYEPGFQPSPPGGWCSPVDGPPRRRLRQRARRELLVDSRPRTALGQGLLDRASARMALFDYIEGWFNSHRRHSSLGMLSPVEFERRWRAQRAEA